MIIPNGLLISASDVVCTVCKSEHLNLSSQRPRVLMSELAIGPPAVEGGVKPTVWWFILSACYSLADDENLQRSSKHTFASKY